MVTKGKAYSTTIEGIGRVESGWVAQTLYEGFRKYVFLFFLILIWMVCGVPFGLLGLTYDMGPIYSKDDLTGKGLTDGVYNYEKEKDRLRIIGWVSTVLVSVLLVAFLGGWIITARRYAFARTIHVAAIPESE